MSSRVPQFVRSAPLTAIAAVAALSFAVVQAGPASAATTVASSTTQSLHAHVGDAYGTVLFGSAVSSGPSARLVIGCTTATGIHQTNTVAGVNVSPALISGTVNTTADTSAAPIGTRTSATVQNVKLLNGLVRAAALRSVSYTTFDATGFHITAAGTTFTSLVVAGHSISAGVAPNSKVNLAGLGYVLLNEHVSRIGTGSAALTVNALHVVITTANKLGLKVGTNLIVAHAYSELGGPIAGTLDGQAYGSYAKLGSLVKSGPSFPGYMPCTGTGGVLRQYTGVGIDLPSVVSSGTIRDTVQGTVTTTYATGETTSSVQSAQLLSALLKATLIKADAHATKNGLRFGFSDSGSKFGSLSVAGFPLITANVAPNTHLTISGVGTLYLHRVIRTPNSIEVRMIELVTSQNLTGIPAGSDIQVAVAEASAH